MSGDSNITLENITGSHDTYLLSKSHLLNTGSIGYVYHVLGSTGRQYTIKIYRLPERPRVDYERCIDEVTPMLHFKTEQDITARLTSANHCPNIKLPLEFIERPYSKGKFGYVILPYSADTLENLIKRFPRHVRPSLIQPAVSAVASALDYLHDHGIIHRDVKPRNVFLGDGQQDSVSQDDLTTVPIQLSDFGVAFCQDIPNHYRGDFIGSALYAPPEFWKNGEITPASDAYSFAFMIYELLTKTNPFSSAGNLAALEDMHINADIPDPRKINPLIYNNLVRVLMKATAKNPRLRFQSAGELSAAFRETLQPKKTRAGRVKA